MICRFICAKMDCNNQVFSGMVSQGPCFFPSKNAPSNFWIPPSYQNNLLKKICPNNFHQVQKVLLLVNLSKKTQGSSVDF